MNIYTIGVAQFVAQLVVSLILNTRRTRPALPRQRAHAHRGRALRACSGDYVPARMLLVAVRWLRMTRRTGFRYHN